MIKVSSVVVVLVLSALADSQKLVDFMGPLHLELHQNDCNGKAAICAGTLAYRKCVPNADGEMVPYGLFIPCPVNTTCLNSENICVPNTTELSDDLSNEKLTATTAEVLTVSNANVNESKNNDIDTTEKMVNDSSVDTVTTNDFTNNDNSNYTADAKVTESTKKVSDNAENSVVFYDNADLNNEETKEVNHKLVESSVFIDEMVNDSNDSATVLRTNDSTIINLNKSEGSDVSGVTADMTTKDTTTNNKGVEPSVQSVEMPNHSSDSVSAASTYDAASVNVGAESLYVSDVTADLTQEENAANEKSVEPPVHTEEIINDAPDPVSTAITDNAAKVNNGVESLGLSEVTAGLSQEENVENNVELSIHTEEMVNDTPYSVSATSADDAANVNIGAESLEVSDTTADWSQEKNVANEKNDESSVHTEEMADDAPDSISANGDAANVNIGAGSLDESDATSDFTQEETAATEKSVEPSVHTEEMVDGTPDPVSTATTGDTAKVNNGAGSLNASDVTADLTQEENVDNENSVESSIHIEEIVNGTPDSVSAASADDAANVNIGAESLDVSDITADWTQEKNVANEKNDESSVRTEEMVNDTPDSISANDGAANVNIDAGSFDESDATSDFTQKETAATEKSVKPSVHTEIKVNDTLDPVSTATTDNAAKVNNDVESLGVSNVTAGLSQEENVVNEKSVEPSVHTEEMVIDTHDSVFAVSTDDTANVNIGAENLDLSDVTADWTQEKNVANEKNDESSVHTEEMVDDTPDSVSAATTGDAAKVNNGAGSLDVSDVTADLIQEENVDNENNVEPLVHTEEMVNDTPNSVSAASADGAANVNIGAESLDVSDTTADWTQEKNVANEKNDESSVNTEEMADDAPDSISANGDAANVNIGAGSLDESDATSDFTQEETAATEKSVEPSVHTEEMIDDTPDPVSTATTGDTAKVNNGAGSLNASDVTADLTQEENVDNENSVESSIHIEEIVNGTPDSVSAASADDAANVNIGAESLDVSDITADWTQEKNVANEKNDESSVRTEEMVNDTPDSISANDGAANVNIDAGSFDESDATSDFTQEEPAATEKSVEPSVHTEQMVSDTPDSVSATNTDDTANVNIGTGSLDVSDIVAGWTQEENVANEKNDESSVHTEEMVDDTPDSISANGDAANVNIGAGSLDESDATSNFTQEDTAANEKYVELSGHTVEIVNDSSESVHLENTNNSANVNPDKPGDSDVSDITVDLTQEEFVTNKYNVEPSVHTEEMVAYSTNYFSEVSTDNTATVNFGAGVSDLHDVSVDLTHDEIAPNYTVEPSNEMVNESTECVNVVNTNDSANVNLASRDSYVSDATHVTQEKTAANENSVELYVHAEDMANDFTDTADSTNDAAYDYHDGMVKLDKSSPTTDLTDAETSANNKEVEMTVSTDDDSNNSVDVAKTNLNIGNTKDSVAYGVISDLIEEENASNKESMEPSTSTKEMVNDLIKNVAGSNAQDSSYEESDFTKKLDISNLTTNSTNDESNKHFAPFSTVKEVLSDSAMDISKSYSKNANSTNEPDDSIYEGSLQNKKHLEQRFITSETTKSENTLPNSEESDEELTDSGIVKVSKTVEVNKNINVMNWQNMYYQYYWKALGDHYKRLGMYFREREQQRRKEMQEEPQKLFEQRSKLAKGMMRTIKEIECKYEEIDNVYPDMKNCKKYYRCINKSNELKLVHLRCDNHKEFDWISLKCVYRYKAFCLGRNRY